MSLARALAERRSCREFADRPLSARALSLLCWSAQGITEPREGFRSAPSAGGVLPVTLLVADREGVWTYEPDDHAVVRSIDGDRRRELRSESLDQACVSDAAACFVIVADVAKMARKYDADAERYCLFEAGHIAQNILLQATALGLGAVPVGAFDEAGAARVLDLPARLRPLYMVPVGHPAAG
ncbi:MAG: SagB/ThcOx family dehydrogenase [Planctomycetota bacterium]|jgi:SagB-type dehydrogenase family enzyme